MKKTISILFALALALALVLTLAAGCSKAPEPDQAAAPEPINVEAGANNNRTGNDGGTSGWPAADLPQGFPEYPDGVVANVDGQTDDGVGMTIKITGTKIDTYNAYLKTLESAGWIRSDENDLDMAYLTKGSWVFWIGYGDPDIVIMYITDNDYNVKDWPAAELPPGFPAYPDGKVTYIDHLGESGMVYVEISETDEETFVAYLETLEAAGWTESIRDGFHVEMGNGSLWLSTEFDSSGKVKLGVVEIGGSSGSDYEWPMGLPYDLPEYPDGDIILVRIGDDDSVSITVNNTTLENFYYYADTLTKSGWTITSTDSSRGEDVFMVYMFDYEDGVWSCAIDLMDANRASIRTSISE